MRKKLLRLSVGAFALATSLTIAAKPGLAESRRDGCPSGVSITDPVSGVQSDCELWDSSGGCQDCLYYCYPALYGSNWAYIDFCQS